MKFIRYENHIPFFKQPKEQGPFYRIEQLQALVVHFQKLWGRA